LILTNKNKIADCVTLIENPKNLDNESENWPSVLRMICLS